MLAFFLGYLPRHSIRLAANADFHPDAAGDFPDKKMKINRLPGRCIRNAPGQNFTKRIRFIPVPFDFLPSCYVLQILLGGLSISGYISFLSVRYFRHDWIPLLSIGHLTTDRKVPFQGCTSLKGVLSSRERDTRFIFEAAAR